MKKLLIAGLISVCMLSCESSKSKNNQASSARKIPVIFDTDANNELDDQHAMAYLFSNQEVFDIKAVTVNATRNGGNIDQHYKEAERIITLFNLNQQIPLIRGADKSFKEIESEMAGSSDFDGSQAVDLIISEANQSIQNKLVVLAVGKLTNMALALKKDPSISTKIRLVWLGANYPEPGEYNLENDIPAMNYVLQTGVEFDMVTVRYGKPSGTDAVKITQEAVNKNMPGLGPLASTPITGRHGGQFNNFGDYSVDLFAQIDLYGTPPSRALFDMAAVAIVKNPDWAEKTVIPCPIMIEEKWVEQPNNNRKITVWENFDKKAIIEDFYLSLKK